MRIGLTGGGSTVDRMIDAAVSAEADGFSSIWYASAIGGDPLVPIALAGRATTSIELGTAVLQTYTCHPVLQARRAQSVVAGMGRPGFTLGVGPSHKPPIEDMLGIPYDRPGAHTEDYVRVLTAVLRGEAVAGDGEFPVRLPAGEPVPVPVLVSALAPRLLRVAGELTDGTVLWMGNARAVASHVRPLLDKAAPGKRIVAGLPVAVHDDVEEARAVAASLFAGYGVLPNYRRLLDIGGAAGPEDAAIVGDEGAVAAEIGALFDAGATDVWAAIFPVGDDRRSSRDRTYALLKDLVSA
ncbi:MAG TPA: TIGR03564 family F420-dependent LLM class oxidoreductase [Acidimicrobiales bacterium]|nr:TIGR03564 family F420-dependent LLM class oxidoreductase [Acidimicrobiales bacterium]